jgi:sugar phosphate isomerase/epimerase
MDIGCSTILYGGHSLAAALDGIRGAGYRAIELCAITGMAPHVDVSDDPVAVRRQIEDAGLVVESIGASGRLAKPDEFRRLIELTGFLGAPAITTGTGGASNDEDSFEQVVQSFRELATVAADRGVVISVKPHVNQAVYNTPTARRFIDAVNSPAVGLNLDASHLIRAGEDPVQAFADLAPYVATARVRDATRGVAGPGPVERQIPGNGDLDVLALARAITALPRPRYAVLEIVGTKDMPLDEVQRVVQTSCERLVDLFGGQ